MAKVLGVPKLVEQLRAKAAMARKDEDVSVIVGYTAAYAIYVHENLTAHHPVGQAKFLEEPFRLLRDEFSAIILKARKAGNNMSQALLLAGLRLQRESQPLCPVDTGNMRASAFTRLEDK
jgi:hypothetical protein